MCHEFTDRFWDRDTTAKREEDETPEFLNEEGGEHEVLTDGGDE